MTCRAMARRVAHPAHARLLALRPAVEGAVIAGESADVEDAEVQVQVVVVLGLPQFLMKRADRGEQQRCGAQQVTGRGHHDPHPIV